MASPPLHRDPQLSPPITEKFAAALGHVVANWGMVGSYLAGIIRFLLLAEGAAGQAITAELSVSQRLTLITTLVTEARIQEVADEWADVLVVITPANKERNRAVHSAWSGHHDGSHSRLHITARNRVTWDTGVVSVDDMEALAERILCVLDRLAAFLPLVRHAATNLRQPYPAELPLAPGQGRRARAQTQSREAKLAGRNADRLRAAKNAQICSED